MRWHKVNIEGLFRGLVIAVSLARLSLLYLGISDTLQMRLIPLFKVWPVQGVREKIEHGECNDKAHWLEAGFTAKPPKQTKLSISVFPSLSGWVLCILLGRAVVCWEMVFIYFGFFCSFMCCFCAVSKSGKNSLQRGRGGGPARFSRKWEVCIYLQHNVDLMKYFLYYTNYLQFVYGGLGFLSGEFFRCSNLQ